MAHKNPRKDYVSSESDLFGDIGYDVTVKSATDVEYHTVSAITPTSPLDFLIPGNDTEYLDLSRAKLKLRLKVVSSSGSDLALQADKTILNYAPANNIIASAFESVKVHLNETEITSKDSLYPYKAHFETLLSYGSDYKKGLAEAGGFFRVKNEKSQDDDGWVSRKTLCDGSKEFSVSGRPHLDIFNQTRYLIPGVDMRLQFFRTADSFALECHGSGKENLKLVIVEAVFSIRKLTLPSFIQKAHLEVWKNNPVMYPGTKVSMKSYSLPIGTYQHTNESILMGLIPQRLIMGIVATENIQGSYGTNPFVFEDHDLQQVIVTCKSEQNTQHTINLDKDSNRMVDAFTSVYDAMGMTNCDPGLDFRLSEYVNGKTIFGFDIRNISEGQAIPQHGNISIYLKFKKAITKSLTVVLYPEYPSNMYITNDRRVYFKDFGVEK